LYLYDADSNEELWSNTQRRTQRNDPLSQWLVAHVADYRNGARK
jgi:hypothetical protein